jgi:hypothetical protein
MKMINAPGKRLRPPLAMPLPPGFSWKELQKAIEERHRPIASYFRSGEGVRLQRRDSRHR